MTVESRHINRVPEVTLIISGTEYTNVKDYSITSDVLQLGDPFACTISNKDGQFTGQINPGDSLAVYMADPGAGSQGRILQLTGLVTGIHHRSSLQGGTEMMIRGADLGWHLQNNTGPAGLTLRSMNYKQLVQKGLDSSWGFKRGSDGKPSVIYGAGLDLRKRLANLIPPPQEPTLLDNQQPVMAYDPGAPVADVLIHWAKRLGFLLNVSSEGELMIFQPNDASQALYQLHYHPSTSPDRSRNNVQSADLDRTIDGLYTDVRCYYQVVNRGPYAAPNVQPGTNFGEYRSPSTLTFPRLTSFSDPDQLSEEMATKRAKWKWQRGQFDSFVANYTVYGHSSMDGYPYAANTVCAVHDDVHGVSGNFYVSQVVKNRNEQSGTTTTLTLHKTGLLGA